MGRPRPLPANDALTPAPPDTLIQGMEEGQLRMRMVTIEPGGVFGPVHDQTGRVGTVDVLHGTITVHRDEIAADYGPGVGWPEDRSPVLGRAAGPGYSDWNRAIDRTLRWVTVD